MKAAASAPCLRTMASYQQLATVATLCAGHLDEAENIINSMPLEAGASLWGALHGACSIHGNVLLEERATYSGLKIDPQNAAVHLLLSHVYAAAKNEEGRICARHAICTA